MSETRKISVGDALSMGVQLHQRGMLMEAESVYQDVLRAVPDQPDALHYLGVLAHQRGESEQGLQFIARSLELVPDQPDALNNLGNINKELGRLEAAEAAYQSVLRLAPQHADTWVNLAVIHRNLKRPELALESLQRAIALQPSHIDAYHNLGNAYRDLGRWDDALAAYRRVAELAPEHEEAPKAIAKLQFDSGRIEAAIETLKSLIALRPDDAVARHLLAAYSGQNIPRRASDQVIRRTFDHFSLSFDEVLASLDYRAPTLVGTRAAELLGSSGPQWRVLDVGCGTGLCGPLLRPMARSLTGVDLSSRMLRQAHRRGVYDELVEGELTEFMNASTQEFDVVLSVDTFVYFGDLVEPLKAAEKVLSHGGWLFFTLEKHLASEHMDGYRLLPHGRYSHTREYVDDVLEQANFTPQVMDEVILRREGKEPVQGLLVVARRR